MAALGGLGAVAEEGSQPNATGNPTIEQTPSSPSTAIPPAPFASKTLDVGRFGRVQVHIQGDLQAAEKKAVFLTVHDIGTNHGVFRDFVEHPCMSEIKQRSVFIHLDLPGQEDNAPDLPDTYQYPTILEMGEEMLPLVLDQLNIKLVVGIGEGAGGNILVRFALKHPQRVLGLVLIHLVSAGVGMLERLKDQFFSGKRRPSECNPDQIIALHKLGTAAASPSADGAPPTTDLISDYRARAQKISARNLRKYAEVYMNRKELPSLNTLDLLLVCGGKSPYAQGVQQIHGVKTDKSKSQLLKIDGVVDCMGEAPDKLAQSLLLFVKGLGFLTSLTLPGVERQRTFSGGSQGSGGQQGDDKAKLGAIGRRRTLSMEEYDVPRIRRLSLTGNASTGGNVNSSPQK